MHIVVVGAGAVGTLYGGWLLAGGGDVSFLARGQRLLSLRSRGLELRGNGQSYVHREVEAAGTVQDLRAADVLILTVKLYDLESAANAAQPALKEGGLVVGLQNGVEAADVLSRVFPPRQVMVGPVYSAATLTEHGVVQYSGARNLVALGSAEGPNHPFAHELARIWTEAGVAAAVVDDIRITLWTKFLAFGTNAALTCLSRQPAGVVYHDPDLAALAARSIGEISAVAGAEGVVLPATAADDAMALLRSFPPHMVASMRQDLDAGRRLELDAVSGAVSRFGRKHGIATPLHDTAYACLKPYRDGNRRPQPECP